MADGDPSLDAGHLGFKIGERCECSGSQHAAKFWYGRAAEENPTIEKYVSARKRLQSVEIDGLLT
jgi:hypothetical protein